MNGCRQQARERERRETKQKTNKQKTKQNKIERFSDHENTGIKPCVLNARSPRTSLTFSLSLWHMTCFPVYKTSWDVLSCKLNKSKVEEKKKKRKKKKERKKQKKKSERLWSAESPVSTLLWRNRISNTKSSSGKGLTSCTQERCTNLGQHSPNSLMF